jgi:hypothetical protein
VVASMIGLDAATIELIAERKPRRGRSKDASTAQIPLATDDDSASGFAAS